MEERTLLPPANVIVSQLVDDSDYRGLEAIESVLLAHKQHAMVDPKTRKCRTYSNFESSSVSRDAPYRISRSVPFNFTHPVTTYRPLFFKASHRSCTGGKMLAVLTILDPFAIPL